MKKANRMSSSAVIKNDRKSGKESKAMLRQRFEAETDIEIEPRSPDWKQYAEWIEKLSVRKINNGLVMENEMLRNSMQEAMNTLEAGISGRALALKKRGHRLKPGRTTRAK